MRSDGQSSPWHSVDDVWKNLSDTPARATDYATPMESGVNMARVARARDTAAAIGVRESIGSVITRSQPKLEAEKEAADPGERKLWRIAGMLIALAVGVLGVLGWLTFAPGPSAPVVAHAEPARAPIGEPARTPRAAVPVISAVEPTVVTGSAKQRPDKRHGKQKAHKRARLAKRR